MRRYLMLSFALFGLASAAPSAAQIPEKFENLKVLPPDIPRDQLVQAMRAFATGLGVRCQYCHMERVAGGGPDGLNLDFKSDEKPAKDKARVMLRMVSVINDTLLTRLEKRSDPPVRVQCVTCHRGTPVPRSLEALLAETVGKQGVDSAVAQYRRLRADIELGRYNFGESTLSALARQLAGSNPDAAVRMLELNQEFFPQSAMIDFQIAELYRTRGDRAKAVEYYRKTLVKAPNHPQARQRLQEVGS